MISPLSSKGNVLHYLREVVPSEKLVWRLVSSIKLNRLTQLVTCHRQLRLYPESSIFMDLTLFTETYDRCVHTFPLSLRRQTAHGYPDKYPD